MPVTRRHLADRVVIALFLVGIAVPAALFLLLRRAPTLAENRPPAPAPRWRLSADFPGRFEAYFRDRFGLRDELVQVHGWFAYHVLSVSPTPEVVRGKHGWLYYAGDHSFDDFQGRRPFTDADLERWRRALEHRRDRLARRGITYVFVVAPNKQTIHPEHLPDTLNRPGITRLDQLAEYLSARSDVAFVDLRPALRQAREKEQLYRQCDSHWNDLGAHAAYQRVLAALEMDATPREGFCAAPRTTDGADLARMLGLPRPPSERWVGLEPQHPRRAHAIDGGTEVDDPDLPRALVLHDSFGEALVPFLAEHFRRTRFIKQQTLSDDLLDRERPDVVIQELCERFLQGAPPGDS
jgi:hypothetical protein